MMMMMMIHCQNDLELFSNVEKMQTSFQTQNRNCLKCSVIRYEPY